MSDEEKKAIEEQYKEGLVNLSNVIEPLINQFKTDYSLDIQQCRLVINYLLMERDFNETYYDELDKEIEELKEKNKKINKYIEDRAKIGKDIQTFINKDYVEQEYISKEKVEELLDRFDLEEALQDEYDELDGCQAVVKILKQLLKEE